MASIKEIESELSKIVRQDKKSWTHFYTLMKEVEEQELWRAAGQNSFTAWVKSFCVNNKIHESIIWSRKKAGKVYERYASEQMKKGIKVPEIENINVPADTLVLLDKISNKAPELATTLTEKALNRELSRNDLREAYKSIRIKSQSAEPAEKAPAGAKETEEIVTATKIVSALTNEEWLGCRIEKQYFKTSFQRDKYRSFTEFPVYTGTTRKSRRIDVLAVENLTTENVWDINLHGIEIKVSKSDLEKDQKFTEYAEFVDFMWLAVPESLIECAKYNKFKSCGIISVHNGKAKIVEQAQRLKPLERATTLTSVALKLI